MSYQPPWILLARIHIGLATSTPPGRILSQNELARDNPETNPITIKPDTVSHVTEQFSWVSSQSFSLPGHLFPIKSAALFSSTCFSLDNSFPSVRQEPMYLPATPLRFSCPVSHCCSSLCPLSSETHPTWTGKSQKNLMNSYHCFYWWRKNPFHKWNHKQGCWHAQ